MSNMTTTSLVARPTGKIVKGVLNVFERGNKLLQNGMLNSLL